MGGQLRQIKRRIGSVQSTKKMLQVLSRFPGAPVDAAGVGAGGWTAEMRSA